MKEKILVIDDNDNIRLYVSTVLTRAGYEVIQTSNGLNGMQILKKTNDIKLILLDIMMPIMGGFDFLQAFKKVSNLSDVKICMMTAISEKEEILKSLKLGAHDYIVKVIDKDILLDKVKRLINTNNDNQFVVLKTNLNANIKGAPFKIDLKVNKLSESYLELDSAFELESNEPITIKVPYLDSLWGEESELICVVETSKQTKPNLYTSKLIFSGLDEDISRRIRELTVNKRELDQAKEVIQQEE